MLRLQSLACLLAAAAALSCPPSPCEPEKCPSLNCKVGTETGFCGCCPVCLRAEGEPCGGIWEGSPSCGGGLECYKPPLRDGELAYNQDGRCREPGNIYT